MNTFYFVHLCLITSRQLILRKSKKKNKMKWQLSSEHQRTFIWDDARLHSSLSMWRIGLMKYLSLFSNEKMSCLVFFSTFYVRVAVQVKERLGQHISTTLTCLMKSCVCGWVSVCSWDDCETSWLSFTPETKSVCLSRNHDFTPWLIASNEQVYSSSAPSE